MTDHFHTLRADSIAVTPDLIAGHMSALEIETGMSGRPCGRV
jgi:hypothetical protein